MKNTDKSQEDLFLLEAGNRYYLYAPLKRSVAVLNGSAACAVNKFLIDGIAGLSPEEQSVVENLKESGLIGGELPEPPVFPDNYIFQPYEVTLFPTTRCNLRCIYCYADSGTRNEELTWDEAKAAIDLVVKNAGLAGRKDFIVGFHGGGEPTLAWSLMCRCVEYAHEQAAQKGLVAHIHTASNGILTIEQRDYIINKFSDINVSLDGPREIQDRHRPRADGKGSFDSVLESLSHFKEKKFPFGIRATVTAQSALRLTEICEFFCLEFPNIKQLHIEPVWYCGRCRTSGEKPPEAMEFVKQFLASREEAKKSGVNLFYSGARLDTITNKFCAAPGDGFSVMPGGYVSSCYEICDAGDPRARIFHYGLYNPDTGIYEFNDDRIRKLRQLSVDHISYCRDCFCKWHCAGDCLSKVLKTDGPEGHKGSERCTINREITMAQLKELVKGSEAAGEKTNIYKSS